MISFRVTTYNIHKCRGLDRRVHPQRIVEVLKETESDVIALQEVVGMDHPERERNQLRSIAEELGFDFRIGENRRLRGGADPLLDLLRYCISRISVRMRYDFNAKTYYRAQPLWRSMT
jgi:hypothetical protein